MSRPQGKYRPDNKIAVLDAIKLHPEGITQQEILDLVSEDLVGVNNKNHAISVLLGFAIKNGSIVKRHDRYFANEDSANASAVVVSVPQVSQKPNGTTMLSPVEKQKAGVTIKVFTTPESVQKAKRLEIVSMKDNIKSSFAYPIRDGRNLKICIGPEFPNEWEDQAHLVDVYNHVLYISIIYIDQKGAEVREDFPPHLKAVYIKEE